MKVARIPTFAWACLIAWTSWPVSNLLPEPGLDPSWITGLHMAAHRGLDFGSDIVFTFGPLGWLTFPKIHYPGQAIAAFISTLGIHLALCYLTTRAGRRSFGPLLGVVIAFLVARAFPWIQTADLFPLIAYLLALEMIAVTPNAKGADWLLPVLAGACAGVGILVKFNSGMVATAIVAIVALGTQRLGRAAATTGAAFVVTACLGWLVARQSIGSLIPYLMGSLSIADGYSSAMVIEIEERSLAYPGAAVAILIVGFLLLSRRSWLSTKGWVLLAACTGVLLFGEFKHGFVRHDAHDVAFFFTALVAAFLLAEANHRWRGLAGVLVLTGLFLVARQLTPIQMVDPRSQMQILARQVLDLVDSRVVEGQQAQARVAMRAAYQLPAEVEARLQGSTVHVDPWEAGVAWAYPGVRWTPLPVFQAYSAYTEYLDRLNAEALTSSEAPELILREGPIAIDGRNPDFESPGAFLSQLCLYREVVPPARWQLLEKATDRCGEARLLVSQKIQVGEVVTVPSAATDELVFARVDGVNETLIDRIKTALFRAEPWYVVLDHNRLFRLVPETSAGPLVLKVPSSINFSGAFGVEDPAEAIAIMDGSSSISPHGSLTIEFYAVPVGP